MKCAERMPPLEAAAMTAEQKKAAETLAAGPRGGVKGPFIALLRSPELMDRMQRVGEYLRFRNSLPQRLSELLMLIVSRQWTQRFEWAVHAPLGLQAGLRRETVIALQDGRRPAAMQPDEEMAYDFCDELARTRGVSDATYRRAVETFGERGVIDMLGVIGYFTAVSMVLNVARTPPPKDAEATPLASFPL